MISIQVSRRQGKAPIARQLTVVLPSFLFRWTSSISIMRTRLVRQQCKNRLSFPSHGHGDGDDACRGGQEDPASKIGNLKQYGELPETARINETAVDMAMVTEQCMNQSRYRRVRLSQRRPRSRRELTGCFPRTGGRRRERRHRYRLRRDLECGALRSRRATGSLAHV